MNKVTEWKPMRTAPKKDGIILLGTIDTRLEEYEEFVGYYDQEISSFTTEDGWVIASVAWRKHE